MSQKHAAPLGQSWVKALVVHLKAFDLRFPKPEDEDAFRLHQERGVLNFAIGASAVTAPFYIFNAIRLHANESKSPVNKFVFDSNDVRTFVFVGFFIMVALLLTFIVFGLVVRRQGCLQKLSWEPVSVAIAVLIMASQIFLGKTYSSRLAGVLPEEAWSMTTIYDEFFVLFYMDAVVTVMLLASTVRVCLLWIVPVGAVCVFVVGIALGPPTTVYSANGTMVLSAMCCLAFHGARRNEQHVRGKWLALRQVSVAEQVVEAQQFEIKEKQNKIEDQGEAIATLTEEAIGSMGALQNSGFDAANDETNSCTSSIASFDLSDEDSMPWIDMNIHLDIQGCSSSFKRLVGSRASGGNFSDLCHDRETITSWFVGQLKRVELGEEVPFDSDFGPMELKTKDKQKPCSVVLKFFFGAIQDSTVNQARYVVRCRIRSLKKVARGSGSGTAPTSVPRTIGKSLPDANADIMSNGSGRSSGLAL